MSDLPAWGKDDLPEPLPFNSRNLFRVIGPGAILLAASIGGGEWLVGPAIAVKHGLGVMWIATVGILLQLLFNLEGIRYTLYTGEPILSGIMRLKPGANFWATLYIGLTAAQLGVPALASGCSSVVFTLFQGRLPAEDGSDRWTLLFITYGVILLAFLLLTFGGTIERMLERISWAMIVYIFCFLIAVNFLAVPSSHSLATAKGFLSFGYLPQQVDWLLLAALATTAGSGGIGNLTITNWVRDKGMGMGGRVGAIPSAIGGEHIALEHVGKVFPVNESNLARWRTWCKYVVADQVFLWGAGCFIGMFLNVNLASAIAPPGSSMEGQAAGAYQARFLSEQIWSGLWYLGLLNGFWILFSTHLGNTDVLVRTVTDTLWTSSSRVRANPRLGVGKLYFAVLVVFTLWGVIVVHFASAMALFKVLAAIAAVVLVPAGFQVLRVNTTLLPPELRPSWWRRAALVACSLFYLAVTCALIWSQIGPYFATK
jgi:hypothetical protein